MREYCERNGTVFKYIGIPRNYIFTFVVDLVALCIKKSGGQGAPRAR
jgi:hypothetical protein